MPERENGATVGWDQDAVRTRSAELRKELSIPDLAFAQIGVGKQEAFQLLWNSAGIFYALTYLAMFAVPLWGLRRSRVRAPWWVKLCAVSGLLMTILYISLSVLPIIPVGSRTIFAIKIAGLIVVTNLVGVAFFVSGRRRAHAERVTVGQSR